jgi:hypothetical protein
MELAAIIIIVVAAGLLAAAGFGIGVALRRWRNISYPAYWFAIAGGVLGALGAGGVIGDWARGVVGSEQIAIDNVLPYMADIKAKEPALYERVETSIVRDQADGKPAEEIRANAKALVSSYVADKIPFLSNELTYEIYATTRDIMGYLEQRDDFEACANLALGRFKGDLDPKLSRELVERNNNTTRRVISAPPVKDAAKMPAEQFRQLASDSFAQASQVTGIAPEEIETLLSGEGEHHKTCKLMKAFIDAMLTQPVDVAAAALRTLASGTPR